ncbi:hypothetical protein [Corynebacterium vitaeruminis]|uniref:hypothetical protein n=1 Tax=Corynebacterium vitaeruminis TaxID=38305 RepID=UPI0018CC49F4|nr:hypothetical protein [Corynebacterium vitaeruminis]
MEKTGSSTSLRARTVPVTGLEMRKSFSLVASGSWYSAAAASESGSSSEAGASEVMSVKPTRNTPTMAPKKATRQPMISPVRELVPGW